MEKYGNDNKKVWLHFQKQKFYEVSLQGKSFPLSFLILKDKCTIIRSGRLLKSWEEDLAQILTIRKSHDNKGANLKFLGLILLEKAEKHFELIIERKKHEGFEDLKNEEKINTSPKNSEDFMDLEESKELSSLDENLEPDNFSSLENNDTKTQLNGLVGNHKLIISEADTEDKVIKKKIDKKDKNNEFPSFESKPLKGLYIDKEEDGKYLFYKFEVVGEKLQIIEGDNEFKKSNLMSFKEQMDAEIYAMEFAYGKLQIGYKLSSADKLNSKIEEFGEYKVPKKKKSDNYIPRNFEEFLSHT